MVHEVLFVGPPGLGKSNLVQILANELGVDLRETLAQTLQQTNDLAALLLDAEPRQILFIDEADELPPEHQTLLYRALTVWEVSHARTIVVRKMSERRPSLVRLAPGVLFRPTGAPASVPESHQADDGVTDLGMMDGRGTAPAGRLLIMPIPYRAYRLKYII